MSDNPLFSNLIVCLLLLLSALIFLWTKDMTPGAELFPRIMAGGLALFGIVELILSIMGMSSTEKVSIDNTARALIRKSAMYMGAFFLLVLGFYIAFPLIGFEISAVVFMLVAMMLLGGKSSLRKWPIAILVPALLILVFRAGLAVRLPSIIFSN
jgi:hypothetical protein